MTASMHKLTAGDGYTYLTRHVAAADSTELGRSALADYYLVKGEKPGRWAGRGLTNLGSLSSGSTVTEAQMKALYGEGLHPDAEQLTAAALAGGMSAKDAIKAARLGRPFLRYDDEPHPFLVKCARRYQQWNTKHGQRWDAAIPQEARAQIRTDVAVDLFTQEYQRAPLDGRELAGYIARASRPTQKAVAGYDVTFSPVKSVSTLWALAPLDVSEQIEAAHDAAIESAMGWMETEVAYTRRGAQGIAQVDIHGLITAGFTHRDSRAGDPDLHTHVVISNKVQAVDDDAWLALDGSTVYKAMVAVSEHYNTALEAELGQRLGLRFDERASERGKRAVREITGVDPELMRSWSSRRVLIEQRHTELAAEFQAARGRPPTPKEAIALTQQATLETREAKHEPRSLAEQRTAWRTQAEQVLGGPNGVDGMVAQALSPSVDLGRTQTVSELVESVVRRVEASRARFADTHLRAEAERHVRTLNLAPAEARAMVDQVVESALTDADTVRLTRQDPIAEPAALCRRDGSSVYDRAHSALYTTARIMAAEEQILTAARRTDGRRVSPEKVAVAVLESEANGVVLNRGQAAMVEQLATCGARVQLALAPAGSGKTTALGVFTRAWSADGGTVIGLAPSAVAAGELRTATGAESDTIAALTTALTEGRALPRWADQVNASTVIVVDEAGMAGTTDLAVTIDWALYRGASVRLIGDDRQLASISAGGVLRDLASEVGATSLTQIMRFSDPAEAAATLAVRDGDHAALGFYLDRNRVQLVDETLRAASAYQAWQADMAAGRDSVMLASTQAVVDDLNARARTDRLASSGKVAARSVVLRSGLEASAGDVIVTRQNDRRLRLSATDWVKNGDRWRIVAIDDRGRVTARHARSDRLVSLPKEYVEQWVELGYATTIHTAQGATVDTTHTVLSGTESRQLFYVATSRGRVANHLYLSAGGDGDLHKLLHPDRVTPPTATDILSAILDRDDAQRSARSELRDQHDPVTVLHRNVGIYSDALGRAALTIVGNQRITELTDAAEQLWEGISDEPAWEVLLCQLALIEISDGDPIAALEAAIEARELDTAHNVAAVLAWRLDLDLGRAQGPLPWLPQIPTPLDEHPVWGEYLRARAEQICTTAAQVATSATETVEEKLPAWAQLLAADPLMIGKVAVWRAATGVAADNPDPLGPEPASSRPPGQAARHHEERSW